MSRLVNNYALGSPTRQCAATGRGLVTGEPFLGALCQDVQTEEFSRLDFDVTAWNSGARPAAPLEVIGTWRGVVPDPNEKRKLLLDEGSLLDLFEQTGEASAGVGANAASVRRREIFRFVLALILIRRRMLVCEKSSWGGEGSRGAMLVRPKGVPKPPEGPALVEVVDPGMTEEDVALAVEQLQTVLIEPGASGQIATPGAS